MELRINGERFQVDVEPEMPLLWVIREQLGLAGTKFGCGIGACGACAVHIDGVAVRSCVVPVASVDGREITTIEGSAHSGTMQTVQAAWIEHQVPQCGYCQTGMIMAVAALLESNPDPSDADIDAGITNLCRCGTYERIRAAIHAAADSISAAGGPEVSNG